MESMFVNWEALDTLVIDFAKSENLFEDSSSSSSPSSSSSSSPCLSLSSSSYNSRLIIRRIRRYLESGDIDSAIDLLQTHAPFVLEKFIELLRKGSEEGMDLAIECLRKALAPCALDAYLATNFRRSSPCHVAETTKSHLQPSPQQKSPTIFSSAHPPSLNLQP